MLSRAYANAQSRQNSCCSQTRRGTCVKGSMYVEKSHAALLDNGACMYSDLLSVADFTYMRYLPTFRELA